VAAWITVSALTPLFAQYFSPPKDIAVNWIGPMPVAKLHLYKVLPHHFVAPDIAAALALASLHTNDIMPTQQNAKADLWFRDRPDESWSRSLAIENDKGTINFYIQQGFIAPPQEVPDDPAVSNLAWQCVSQLGIDRSQMLERTKRVHACVTDKAGNPTTYGICSRGVVLTRMLDGIEFYAESNVITSGFLLDVGNHSQINDFQLVWPDLEAIVAWQPPTKEKVIEYLKQGKLFIPPEEAVDVEQSEAWQKKLAEIQKASKITINKATARYSQTSLEGVMVAPLLELEATAELPSKTITFRLLSLFDASNNTTGEHPPK
jgi:hypothetical protein